MLEMDKHVNILPIDFLSCNCIRLFTACFFSTSFGAGMKLRKGLNGWILQQVFYHEEFELIWKRELQIQG